MDPALRVWLVPLLPLAGFLFQAFLGWRLRRGAAGLVSCGAVLASAGLSWGLARDLWAIGDPAGRRIVADLGPWIDVPGLKDGALSVAADLRLVVDPLSSLLMLVVTNVGFLIHLYSTGYMAEDRRYARYFGFLNLFVGFMLLLVMASNLLLMFVGWEGVGLCSYLLIGFWFEKRENAAAGLKAFIVNRVGDLGLVLGMLTLFVGIGRGAGIWTLEFEALRRNAEVLPEGTAALAGILLLAGASGKSAQLPLHVWLPDAMAGPTPVSALIHAATMVTAGVYMIARMGFLYLRAPSAMAVVAAVGALTAFAAATVGMVQNDIKRVLAYSTVSQLGLMFLGVGAGAFAAGIFHLTTHAFFKSCLFLGAGSVIHGMGGEQDIRKMGGLRGRMPWTFGTFLAAALAIAGIPFFSGFFSKDEILWRTFRSGVLPEWLAVSCWGLGAAAAAGTAFYVTRLVVKVFLGSPARAGGAHGEGPHEAPWSMRLPLVVLAAGSVAAGFLGVPHLLSLGLPADLLGRWLEPVLGTPPAAPGWRAAPGLEGALMGTAFVLALGGLGTAAYLYRVRQGAPARAWAERHAGLYRWVREGYFLDAAYDRAVVRPLLALNEGIGRFDNGAVDGAVNGVGRAGAELSRGAGGFDHGVVDAAVNAGGQVAQELGRRVRRLQTGRIRHYLATALVGGLSLLVFTFLCLIRNDLRRLFGE